MARNFFDDYQPTERTPTTEVVEIQRDGNLIDTDLDEKLEQKFKALESRLLEHVNKTDVEHVDTEELNEYITE